MTELSSPTPTPDEPVVNEPADISELLTIPNIGPSRAHALADAGFRTIADLRAAPVEQIGAVKGVGLHEAERIKARLETPMEAPAVSEPIIEPTVEEPQPEASVDATASENQTIQDRLATLESAIALIRHALPEKKTDKKLLRQFDKLIAVASDIPESMDTLKPKAAQSAVKSLEKLATLVETAASYGALHPKEQETLREKLRERRKSLQKALGV